MKLPTFVVVLSVLSLSQKVTETTSSAIPKEEPIACPSEPAGVEMSSILPGIANGTMVVVDVRRPEELRETGKIPGGYNIELSEMEAAFSLAPSEFEVLHGFAKPTGNELVITCRSGKRATQAWKDIEHLGYCHARVYFGSFDDWAANDQPIETVN